MNEEIVVAPSAGYDWEAPWIKVPLSLKYRFKCLWEAIMDTYLGLTFNPLIPTHDSEALNKWYWTKEKKHPFNNFYTASAISQFDTFLRGYHYRIQEKN